MSWLESPFKAEQVNGRIEGFGEYRFPDGTLYTGEFKDGQFCGQGVLLFLNGGKYEGTFKDGCMVQGTFSFQDGLVYDPNNWDYCSPGVDRRFYTERINGFAANLDSDSNKNYTTPFAEKLVNEKSIPVIPKGAFDVGDGYYSPTDGVVYSYEALEEQKPRKTNQALKATTPKILRKPTQEEVSWILEHCRVSN